MQPQVFLHHGLRGWSGIGMKRDMAGSQCADPLNSHTYKRSEVTNWHPSREAMLLALVLEEDCERVRRLCV